MLSCMNSLRILRQRELKLLRHRALSACCASCVANLQQRCQETNSLPPIAKVAPGSRHLGRRWPGKTVQSLDNAESNSAKLCAVFERMEGTGRLREDKIGGFRVRLRRAFALSAVFEKSCSGAPSSLFLSWFGGVWPKISAAPKARQSCRNGQRIRGGSLGRPPPHPPFPMSQVPWANVRVSKKGKETPTGFSCLSCAQVVAIAYPTATWSSVVAMAKSDVNAKRTLTVAKQVLAEKEKMQSKRWVDEAVNDETLFTVVVAKQMWFLTISEFEEHFGKLSPAVPTVEVSLEDGKLATGVLLRDTQQAWRRVTLESRKTLALRKHVADAGEMLRPLQNSELFEHLVAKGQGKGGKSKAFAALTEEELRALAVATTASLSAPEKRLMLQQASPMPLWQ